MRNKILTGILLAFAAAPSLAATATSTATVTIENQAITLSNTRGLNFGTILPYGRPGAVGVNAAGGTSTTNAFISDATNVSASAWAVTGIPNAPYAVSLPSSATISNGSENMTINTFTRSGGTSQLALDASGNASFGVGATLNVGANQPAGVYSGTFDVTVNYN